MRRVSRLERPLVRHVTSTRPRHAAQVHGSHTQSFQLRQTVNPPKSGMRTALILTLFGKMLLINNIDQQHVRGQTLQGKSWWHWYHSALVQHSDQQHNILWTPCCSRHQPLRSERVTASSSGFASGRRTESRAFFMAPQIQRTGQPACCSSLIKGLPARRCMVAGLQP